MLPVAVAEAKRLGIVRPSNLSGLDLLGVPCWQLTRPNAADIRGNVSATTGKGWTNEAAMLGAYMEAIERHWAERCSSSVVIAKPSELRAQNKWHLPLAVVPLPSHLSDPGDVPLAWVRGTTFEGNSIFVPAHEVWCPYSPPPDVYNPAIWHSTGLAAGANLTEAVFHALLEVIERNAMALAELCEIGVSVDLATVQSENLKELLRTLETNDISVEVKSLDSTAGIYTFAAFLDDRKSQNPLRINGGHSSHVDPTIAIEDAVLEAVQSRAAFIAGSREDLERYEDFAALGYSAARATMNWWLTQTQNKVRAPQAPLANPLDLSVALQEAADRLRREKFWPLIFVPMSPLDASIFVVRVLVPSASQASEGNIRIGRSILEKLSSEKKRASV